jgi:SPP1 gp7 family putative phage head morphogenesis protein
MQLNTNDPFSVTFDEAIAYAESREVVLPDAFYDAFNNLQRQQTVSIAGLSSIEQIKYIMNEVNDVFKNGGTFKSFQAKVSNGDFTPELPKHRLDNIFRTNIQAAYNHGRWQQQKNSITQTYLMYDAINDSRTRPAHLSFDNTILPRDHPWFRKHYPPCGYRCRCTTVALTENQALARGGVTAKPSELEADNGFDFHPDDYGKGVELAIENSSNDLLAINPKLSSELEKLKQRLRELRQNKI